MRYLNKLTAFLLTFFIVFFLSACGSPLEKPTGLEETETEQHISEDEEEVNEHEGAQKNDDLDSEKKKDKVEEKDKKNEVSSDVDETSEKSTSNKHSNTKVESSSEESTKSAKNNNDNTSSKKIDSGSSQTKNKNDTKKEQTKKEGKTNAAKSSTPTKKTETKKTETKDTVVHSIVISSGEIPMSPTEIEITNGDTVLDALKAATRKHGIQMDYKGSGGTAYIQGINNVYEFDRGQGSGWMYRVNGVFPDRGAGAVSLQDGDRVEWLYTTNLGADLGAELKPFRR